MQGVASFVSCLCYSQRNFSIVYVLFWSLYIVSIAVTFDKTVAGIECSVYRSTSQVYLDRPRIL